ncbi:MAG: DUF3795 domain-containing protein [Clostridia bacterium]|nr:DUF3795 domain-containing protein [Clostridia bacterium]
MAVSICGLDCAECGLRNTCGGCSETDGKPFGGDCMIAVCCRNGSCPNGGKCFRGHCRLKKELIAEFNGLGIADMEEVTDLNALWGAYINQQYPLPGGGTVKIWDDDKVYLGNQLRKKNSSRCYGIAADENYLLVCEYGEEGADAEIILFRKRDRRK